MQAGLALATLPWLAESAQAALSAQKSPLSTSEPMNKLSDIARYNNFTNSAPTSPTRRRMLAA